MKTGWAVAGALIVAPLLALAAVTFGYAAAGRACEREAMWMVHFWMAAPLALSLAATVLAYFAFSRSPTKEMLPLVATWNGAFFSLVIAGQWLAVLFLKPCMH